MRIVLFLLLGGLAPLITPSALLQAQDSAPEARVLDTDDEEQLEAWARDRLSRLDAAGGGSAPAGARMEGLWAHYFLSVARRDAEKDALRAQEGLSEAFPEGSAQKRTVAAIGGALEVIRGRNSRWPPNKLEHVRKGLEILDTLVREHPEALEVRYLRLVSCFYLPFFFDREESVKADMTALISGLHEEALAFPPDDPLYGRGPPPNDDRVFLGDMALTGERGLVRLPADWLLRQRYNPFYAYLQRRVLAWIADASVGGLPIHSM